MKFLASAGGLFKDAKRENRLYYKGLFRSATTACEPRGSTALLTAFNLAIQISERFEAPQGACCFFVFWVFFFFRQFSIFSEISLPVKSEESNPD